MSAVFIYGFTYLKAGLQIYSSHLDVLRLLNRAARRAELPVALTEGFHKHLRIKLHRALKLGLEAQNETGEIVLRERFREDDIRERWQKQLPEDFRITALTLIREQGSPHISRTDESVRTDLKGNRRKQ